MVGAAAQEHMRPLASRVRLSVMAWDAFKEAEDVLNLGLPDPPMSPAPGVTFPAARHCGQRFGAVLFLRLWRNGQWDSDTVICARGDNGNTQVAQGGGGWLDPYRRTGDEPPLTVMGSTGTWIEDDDGSELLVTAVEGACSPEVSAIQCTTLSDSFIYPVESRLRAFVIVAPGPVARTLTALDASGNELQSLRYDPPSSWRY